MCGRIILEGELFMKIRKHFTLIALIAILGIAITACDNDNGNLNRN
jgi:hypothetical protein